MRKEPDRGSLCTLPRTQNPIPQRFRYIFEIIKPVLLSGNVFQAFNGILKKKNQRPACRFSCQKPVFCTMLWLENHPEKKKMTVKQLYRTVLRFDDQLRTVKAIEKLYGHTFWKWKLGELWDFCVNIQHSVLFWSCQTYWRMIMGEGGVLPAIWRPNCERINFDFSELSYSPNVSFHQISALRRATKVSPQIRLPQNIFPQSDTLYAVWHSTVLPTQRICCKAHRKHVILSGVALVG